MVEKEKKFFDQAIFEKGKYSLHELDNRLISNKEFISYYKGHYKKNTEINDRTEIFLKHLIPSMQEFLCDFHKLHKNLLSDHKVKHALTLYWKREKIPKKLISLILNYRVNFYKNNQDKKIISTLNGEDVRLWYRELNTQLVKNSYVISKLLQPLNKEYTNHGVIINITNSSVLDSDTRQFIQKIQEKYDVSYNYGGIREIIKNFYNIFFRQIRNFSFNSKYNFWNIYACVLKISG